MRLVPETFAPPDFDALVGALKMAALTSTPTPTPTLVPTRWQSPAPDGCDSMLAHAQAACETHSLPGCEQCLMAVDSVAAYCLDETSCLVRRAVAHSEPTPTPNAIGALVDPAWGPREEFIEELHQLRYADVHRSCGTRFPPELTHHYDVLFNTVCGDSRPTPAEQAIGCRTFLVTNSTEACKEACDSVEACKVRV